MIALAALQLAVAAVSDGPPPPPPPSPEAVQAKGAMNSAMDFVSAIYRKLPDYDGAGAPFAPKLAALMDRDRAYEDASGRDGAIDGFALCGCKSLGDQYRLTRMTAHASTTGTMAVDARLWIGSAWLVTIDLVRAGAAWQIADVHSPKVPSLVAQLEREVPREEADLRAHPPAPKS